MHIRTTILILISFILVSWGQLGHKTIGHIAEKHLSLQAKESIKILLEGQSLAAISTWADEVRGSAEFRHTGPQHYINLPTGLSKENFNNKVIELKQDNIYKAVQIYEKQLLDPKTSNSQKEIALKFLVHFIGDLHQPMHVSRAEDQGGNKVQVNFLGRGTNLHSLWDSRLLEHQMLSEIQLANKVNKADKAQISNWQNDKLLTWLWESYTKSSQLYQEIEKMSSRSIGEQYHNTHIPTAERRLEMAGIRLAGILNEIFAKAPAKGSTELVKSKNHNLDVKGDSTSLYKTIELQELGNYIGQNVKVCGEVYGARDFSNMLLVNLGAAYPNQFLTLVLKGEARTKWREKSQKIICVTGKVTNYRGKPQIEIDSRSSILNW